MIVGLLALAAGGCDRRASPSADAGAEANPGSTATAPAPPKTVHDYLPVRIGETTLRLQFAITMPEMQRGLMQRTDLPADAGMVFIYLAPQRLSFWMRNTPTPLDIGFFDAMGNLREVYPLHPHNETPVQSVGERLKFAIELNQGTYARLGLKPGQAVLNLADVAAALRARGYDPAEYGIRSP